MIVDRAANRSLQPRIPVVDELGNGAEANTWNVIGLEDAHFQSVIACLQCAPGRGGKVEGGDLIERVTGRVGIADVQDALEQNNR